MAASEDPGLWPRPRSVEATGGSLTLSPSPVLGGPAAGVSVAHAVDGWHRRLEGLGYAPRPAPGASGEIRLAVDPAGLPGPESYRLEIAADGIVAVGADAAGLYYAGLTLTQWLEAHAAGPGCEIPWLTVLDRPSFRHRGVLLDVSRNRVPTMETLFELVDRFSDWKLNQLQLYTEHTFAYAGHETVWRDASPLTGAEIRELDLYCRERFVELVPNQNSFGHFHRWLVHDAYRPLAECPEGVSHPFSERTEPFSLCPTDPRSLALLADLYDQLLPNFTSSRMNAGLDETFDLGLGRSAEACAERGQARIYLEHLEAVHGLLADRGRRLQFWGDIVLDHPELIFELPRDAIPLAWGYEADHPFADQLPRFAESGLEFYVCPGTSSWNSLAGRTRNALANLSAAAVAGAETGASGYLITDWGDFGHLQPLASSWPGFLAGAGFAWSASEASAPFELPVADLLDRHVYGEPGLGEIGLELGDAHRTAGPEIRNGTTLFSLLIRAREDLAHARYDGLDPEGLAAARERLDGLARRLDHQPARSAEARRARRELSWVAAALGLACQLGELRLRAGRERLPADLPAGKRRVVATRLGPLTGELRSLWRTRSRPGGLQDSVARLEDLRALLT